MKYLPLTGRILYSLLFLISGTTFHFTEQAVGYAAANGVPAPAILVPLSGIIAILGALSIVTGFKARLGAWMIVVFLIPVTFFMHAFWKETEPMMAQMQMTNFLKNISMLGAAIMIAYFGSGPLSIMNGEKVLAQKLKTSDKNL